MPELPEVETTVRAIRPFENTILKKISKIHSHSLFKVFIDASPRHVWKIKNSK